MSCLGWGKAEVVKEVVLVEKETEDQGERCEGLGGGSGK